MRFIKAEKKNFLTRSVPVNFVNYSIFTVIYMGSSKRIGLFFRNLKKKTSVLHFLLTNVTNW